MNKNVRIEKIEDVLRQSPSGTEKIVWKDKLESMPVHEIPLEYLVYNKYNGRILSRTKSLETQGKTINPETESGKKIIEQLLWDSKEDRNKRTKADIEKYGQKKVGIITKDGVIIDGNRRAMLLNQIDKFDYFRAIILPVTSDEDSIEIEKLETSYQMGEDEKLSYNPIEVYLKTTELYKKLSGQGFYDKNNKDKSAIKKIYEWIGDYKAFEKEKGVEERLEIMNIMNEYLDYYEYNGYYTQLDEREDQFINLTKWLNIFYDTQSANAGWGYRNSDVDDLKTIAFDYIRIKFEGKNFRYLAHGRKENHFFGNEKIWDSFRDKHFDIIDNHAKEEKINFDSEDLAENLDDRDNSYRINIGELLKENFSNHHTLLGYNKAKDEPEKLIDKAIGAMSAINRKSKFFNKPEVLDKVNELTQITSEIIQESSPVRTLRRAYEMLSSIEIDSDDEDRDEVLEEIKKINKVSFDIKKILGG